MSSLPPPMYFPPQGGYAPPTYAPPAQPYPRPQPAASAVPPSSPPPKVRFQRPDDPPGSERRPEPTPATLTLPPPEELGIGGKTAAADIDWNAVHRRLNELGSQSLQLQRTSDGYRCVCVLPTADPGRTRPIEAQAPTEAEAVRLALARAEALARGK
ncbi:MAG TPA: hypothetical protein VKA46_20385 [Gemmataceae bacterium]|nr:hypothetical protein [Gemmataceae bacterium]